MTIVATQINMPFCSDEAFKMTNSDFKTKYGTDKPSIDSNDVVFYCRSGRRSGLALGIVHPLGYSK